MTIGNKIKLSQKSINFINSRWPNEIDQEARLNKIKLFVNRMSRQVKWINCDDEIFKARLFSKIIFLIGFFLCFFVICFFVLAQNSHVLLENVFFIVLAFVLFFVGPLKFFLSSNKIIDVYEEAFRGAEGERNSVDL